MFWAKFLISSGLLLVASGNAALAQVSSASDPRAQWLKENAYEVRSIDPADEDFSDLTAFKKSLSDVRVVLLGEATHGDGAAFLAKTRLIKFLHQEMGFDVLVFESGFYDCSKAWQLFEAGEEIHTAFRRCVWPMWAERQQVQALIDYMGEAHASGHPLVLAGLDPDFVGSPSGDYLAEELRGVIESNTTVGLERERITEFLEIVEQLPLYLSRSVEKPSAEAVESFVSTAAQLARAVEVDSALAAWERTYWARVLENLVSHARFRFPASWPPELEAVELRDRQMARNLTWLMRDRYPNRKFVVWAASLHNARNLRELEIEGNQTTPFGLTVQELYRQKRVMGDYLWEDLGKQVYSLVFTAFEGEFSVGAAHPRKLNQPSAGSLEDLLAQAALDNAIVDFRRLASGGDWLWGELTSRPLGYTEMTARWNTIVDGMMFIREMTPSTRVSQ